MTDCVFERNSAVRGGGGAFFNQGFPTLVRCLFVEDSTWAFGGGIHFAQSTPTIMDCDFQANWADSAGGGVHCWQSNAVLGDCSFVNNASVEAGGGGASFAQSWLAIARCMFAGNAASYGGGLDAGRSFGTVDDCSFVGNASVGIAGGGGLRAGDSDIDVRDSVFEENSALRGGGYSLRPAANCRVDGCTFRGNHAEMEGGGMRVSFAPTFSEPIIVNCRFEENSAVVSGGGLACYLSSPEVSSCLFVNNATGGAGGAISCDSYSSPAVTSCTLCGNSGTGGGGALTSTFDSSPTLQSCIVVFSDAGGSIYCDTTSGAVLSCSDVYGNAGGDWVGCVAGQEGTNGNFSADPLFCDPLNGDYHLAENSACANAPGCGLVGAFPVGSCGTVVGVEGILAETPRLVHLGPSTPNPFRDSAEIRYVVAAPDDHSIVRLDMYGADGRLVRRLLNGPMPPGTYRVAWDGRNEEGQRLAPGIYFGRLLVGERSDALRVVLIE